jgi:AcrR family transcriptional regulator
MPRIDAANIAEHRASRRDHLVTAATALMRSEGTVSMSAVAREVGLSRSAIYEYYASAADLIADVLIDELALWSEHLEAAVAGQADPQQQVRAWMDAVFAYVNDGRHALVRAAGTAPLPPVRRAQVQQMHRGLSAPLVRALGADAEAIRRAQYIWGAMQVAINAIEAGACVQEQADLAWSFCQAGLHEEVL